MARNPDSSRLGLENANSGKCGNAILPNGVIQTANPEIGVPGLYWARLAVAQPLLAVRHAASSTRGCTGRRTDNGERLVWKRSIDLDDGTASGGGLFGQARRDRARHRVNALGFGGPFAEQRNRLGGIAADTDPRIYLDFTEQRHAVGFRDAAAFSVAKDVNAALAMRAIEETHVLDDPENIHVDLAEHFEGLADISKSNY